MAFQKGNIPKCKIFDEFTDMDLTAKQRSRARQRKAQGLPPFNEHPGEPPNKIHDHLTDQGLTKHQLHYLRYKQKHQARCKRYYWRKQAEKALKDKQNG
jgi:hypothetical protein